MGTGRIPSVGHFRDAAFGTPPGHHVQRPKKVASAGPKDRDATVLNRTVPTYPPDAYRAREEGTVVVKAQVDELGNASDVEIVSRSGSRILDRAAMNEVRKWKFSPAIKDGRTVTSSVQVPVDYRLDEE